MKLQVTALAAVIIMFAACSKTETMQNGLSPASDAKVGSVISTSDFQSRVQLFNLLTTKERFSLWHDHLVKAKKQFTNEGSPAKAASVEELLANLTEDVFDINSEASAVFSNYFIPRWNETAKAAFTPKELYDIGFNPGAAVIGRFADGEIGSIPDGGASCFCHVGTTGYSCRRITVSFPAGVTITNGICERNSAECTGSSTGCGLLWLQSCYGNHCQF